MKKNFSKTKGSALIEYAIIAALFALVVGIAVFQMSPDIMRKYFERSIDDTGSTKDGTFQMKPLGE